MSTTETQAVPAGTWAVDKVHSNVGFAVDYMAGTFTGSFVGTEMQVVHSDGSINLHGSLVLTGSIGNSSGTLVFTYEGRGNAVTGHENLHGVGTRHWRSSWCVCESNA